MKVVWSPLALQKLGDAAEFIALDSPKSTNLKIRLPKSKTLDQVELIGFYGS